MRDSDIDDFYSAVWYGLLVAIGVIVVTLVVWLAR
jgi:hypothetical protein